MEKADYTHTKKTSIYLALYFRQFKQKSKIKLKKTSTIWLLEQLMYLGCKEPSKEKHGRKLMLVEENGE